jgi:hypothetical protein
MSEHDMLSIFYALCFLGGIFMVATIKTIRDSNFLDLREPAWLNLARCSALVFMGFGILGMAKFHSETGKMPWAPEWFVLIGIDIYLGVALLSSWLRCRQRTDPRERVLTPSRRQ